MGTVWRLTRRLLGKRKRVVVAVFLITVAASSAPYAFSMLGKWLVDETAKSKLLKGFEFDVGSVMAE